MHKFVDGVEVPLTEEETAAFEAEQKKASNYKKSKEYRLSLTRAKRASEYPDIGDQLDAIMKWIAGENEISVTPELKSLAMQCMSVKSKHRKPK